jgi:hypothetical protein
MKLFASMSLKAMFDNRNRMNQWLRCAILAAAVSTAAIGQLRGQDKRAPELHPLNSEPISIRIISQTPGTLYETIARLVGISVVWDPEAKAQSATARFSVDISKASLREALDMVATVTKTSWIPTSDTTIAVTRRQ